MNHHHSHPQVNYLDGSNLSHNPNEYGLPPPVPTRPHNPSVPLSQQQQQQQEAIAFLHKPRPPPALASLASPSLPPSYPSTSYTPPTYSTPTPSYVTPSYNIPPVTPLPSAPPVTPSPSQWSVTQPSSYSSASLPSQYTSIPLNNNNNIDNNNVVWEQPNPANNNTSVHNVKSNVRSFSTTSINVHNIHSNVSSINNNNAGTGEGIKIFSKTVTGTAVMFNLTTEDLQKDGKEKEKDTFLLSRIKQEMLVTEMKKSGMEIPPQLLKIGVENEHDQWLSLVSSLSIENLQIPTGDEDLSAPPSSAPVVAVANPLSAPNLSIPSVSPPLSFSPATLISKSIPWSFGWMKNLEILELSNFSSITSFPSNFSNLQFLSELSITHANIKTIPSEFSAFITLKKLNLSHNHITAIPSKLMNALSQLKILNLSHNKLKELPSEMSQLVNLYNLDLSDNKLSKIPTEFKSLIFVMYLNLSNNQLGAGVLNRSPIQAISSMESLTCLHLSSNKLSSIPLTNLMRLTELHINDNQISSIPSLLHIQSLQVLDLSDNMIENVSVETLSSLGYLRVLKMSSNKVKFIPAAISSVRYLQEIDLSNNRLSVIPDALNSLVQIKAIRLSGNEIYLIQKDVFAQLVRLERLELDNNKISKIPEGFFDLPCLKHCDLSNNNIQEVPDCFHSNLQLQFLSLANNALTTIPRSIANLESSLQNLELHGNPNLSILPPELLSLKLVSVSISNVLINAQTLLISFLSVDESKKNKVGKEGYAELEQIFSLLRSGCPHPLFVFCLSHFAAESKYLSIYSTHFVEFLPLLSFPSSFISSESAKALSVLALNDLMRKKMSATQGMMETLLYVGQQSPFPQTAYQAFNTLAHLCLDEQIAEAHQQTLIEVCLQNEQSSPHEIICNVSRKLLATLGYTDHLDKRIPISTPNNERRGIRILCMDGGGTKSVSTVNILLAFERETGKKVHELFDLICGTSVGGILACLLGINCYDCTKVIELQKKLFKEIFSAPGSAVDQNSISAKFSLLSNMISTGGRYDTIKFEKVCRENFGEDQMIDTSEPLAVPKVFVASVLMDVFPPVPYLFRNYQYKPGRKSRYLGTSQRRVWEGVRATSAAPSMFAECTIDGSRFSDGGLSVNNPTGLAYHEFLNIWGKERKIDCIVSVGTGAFLEKKQSKTLKDLMMSVIECATSTERVDEIMQDFFDPSIYFRFNVFDDVFDTMLDEVRDDKLTQMELATARYVEQCKDRIKLCCDILNPK